ncbi:hypothetical protein V6Z11_D08G024300 [Gossypium hirsutum]
MDSNDSTLLIMISMAPSHRSFLASRYTIHTYKYHPHIQTKNISEQSFTSKNSKGATKGGLLNFEDISNGG